MTEEATEPPKAVDWVKWAKMSGASSVLSLVVAFLVGFIIGALGGEEVPMIVALVIGVWTAASFCVFGVSAIGYSLQQASDRLKKN